MIMIKKLKMNKEENITHKRNIYEYDANWNFNYESSSRIDKKKKGYIINLY